jgi:hypothetical protein
MKGAAAAAEKANVKAVALAGGALVQTAKKVIFI